MHVHLQEWGVTLEFGVTQGEIVREAVWHPLKANKPMLLRELSLVGIDIRTAIP